MAMTENEKLQKLQMEVEDLQKQLSFLNKSKIPELESKLSENGSSSEGGGENSGSSSEGGGENSGSSETGESLSTMIENAWELVYDWYDNNLNYGWVEGLKGGHGYVTFLPDLKNYTYMRIRIQSKGSSYKTEIYKISDLYRTSCTELTTEPSLLYLYSLNFYISDTNPAAEGVYQLNILNAYRITLYTSKYIAVTKVNGTVGSVLITRIELMK